MFNDHEIYGVSQIKKGQGLKPKECSEIKAEIDEDWNEPHSLRNIDDLMLRMKIEEYKQQCGKGCGNGLVRAGNGLRRAGNGLKRAGNGLRRAGNGLKRSGEGMAGMLETSDDTMVGGCYECECEDEEMPQKERPKIGQELKELMMKQFCK